MKRTLESLVLGRDEYRTEAKFSSDEAATRISPFPDLVIPLAEVGMPARRS